MGCWGTAQTTIEQCAEWLALLEAELARREQRVAQEAGRGEDARQRLLTKLDKMAERARAAPGWREPTAAEREARRVDLNLNRWFAERGYSIRLGE